MDKIKLPEISIQLARMGIFPVTIYLAVFVFITFPQVLLFSTHFFAGLGDGLHRIWDIWWLNKAVSELNQSPWYTTHLHYPYGTSLLGHTLTPLKGFMGIILLRFLDLTETYNSLVIFSFAFGGFTAFLLSYYFTKAYWPSIIAGGIFTYSSFHFAHLPGHLGLISLEWIPLFLLFWLILFQNPRLITAIAAALSLFAVFLSNYYYFLYCILAAVLIFIWHIFQKHDPFFYLRREYLIAISAFLSLTLVTVGPILIPLLLLNAQDPFIVSNAAGQFVGHDPLSFSLDALSLIIPGARWRFSELTKSYWTRLPGLPAEHSVYLGIPSLFFIAYIAWKRKDFQSPDLGIWYLIFIFFTLMALGPQLQISGHTLPIAMPYSLLEKALPPVGELSGVPVRMVVMSTLSAAVISALGFRTLLAGPRGMRFLAGIMIALLIIEYLPKPIPTTLIPTPKYISLLSDLPAGGFLDTVDTASLDLYYQTIHEKPIAFGKLARTPKSVREQDLALRQVIASGDYERLFCEYGFRYLATGADVDLATNYPWMRLLYDDSEVRLYDLSEENNCGLAN
ncbi:MAG: hypothetical protein HYX86_02465 [Chloroflexi bacterium]|nr:hypothetical protein [Chloroflexota bacterium]